MDKFLSARIGSADEAIDEGKAAYRDAPPTWKLGDSPILAGSQGGMAFPEGGGLMTPGQFYVALVGEQTLPNVIPAMALQPREWWFVYSEERFRRQEIDWMVRFWKTERPQVATSFHTVQVDPFSPEAVAQALRSRWEQAGRPDGLVNVTGGTKPMSFGAFEFGRAARLPIAYYQGGRLLSFNPDRPISCDRLPMPELTPRQLLAAYGKHVDLTVAQASPTSAQIAAAQMLGKAPAAATVVATMIRTIAHGQVIKKEPPECRNRDYLEQARQVLGILASHHLVRFRWPAAAPLPTRLEVLDEAFFGKGKLGAWLEIYVADVAGKVFGKTHVTCQLPLTWETDRQTNQPPEGAPKSEVDVLVAHRNQLWYFSCKCDRQGSQVETLSKELLSIDATARSIGGALTRKILVTNADLSERRDVQVKARIMRIDLIDRSTLPRLEEHLRTLIVTGRPL